MAGSEKEVIGHEIQWRFLTTLRDKGTIPRGLLFVGPEGVGKRLLAKAWIKTFYPRDQHRLIEIGAHPDVFFLEKNGGEILVGDLSAVREFAYKRPAYGERKFALIDDAHRMNAVCANAFLKLLEEPPGELTFVLITSRPSRMLATIRSRCLSLRFGAPRANYERPDWRYSEGRFRPLLEEDLPSAKERFRKAITTIRGRPQLVKDRAKVDLGLRYYAMALHDALANRIGKEVAYGLFDGSFRDIGGWIEAGELVFESYTNAEMANLALLEARLSAGMESVR